MRYMAMIAIAVGGACGRGGPGAPSADAWLAPCDAALARAAHEPSWRRARTIVDGCRPCGVAWDPVIARPVPAPSRVVAMLDACKLDCPRPARADFYAAISALEEDQAPREAWRGLARSCPAALGAPGDDGRYASGAWFALDQIARHLPAGHSAPAITLPLWSQAGTGLVLAPPARAPDAIDGLPLVTITDTELFVADAPRVTLVPGVGLSIAGEGWPGRRLDPSHPPAFDHGYALVAPIGLPAPRLAEVVRTLGPPRAMVTAAPGDALFGGEIAGLNVPQPTPSGWPPSSGTAADAIHALEASSPQTSP